MTLLNNTVLLMISGSRHKCQLPIYVVAAEIWVNCLCPTYPPAPWSWWLAHPVSCQRPLHIPQGTSSQAAFIIFSFSFLFFCFGLPWNKNPWDIPTSSSLSILLLPPPAPPSRRFSTICPYMSTVLCIDRKRQFSSTTRQQFRFEVKAGHQSALRESHHSVQAEQQHSKQGVSLLFSPKRVHFLQTQSDCLLHFRGQAVQFIYQLAPSGATDLPQRPGSGPDHCQRDGLNGFRPLLMLFSNVLTFP